MPASDNNWRFNPFTEITNDVAILSEIHTIAYDEHANAYGIRLAEGIKLTGSLPFNVDSDYSITESPSGPTFSEVARGTNPSAGQFRVDYDANTYYSTSFIEFNASDDGTVLTVDYRGTGTVVESDNVSNLIIEQINSNTFNYLNRLIPLFMWQGERISTANIDQIAFDGTTYVGIGPDGSGGTQLVYSTDLSSWSNCIDSISATATPFRIIFANGIFLAVGEEGFVATSADGITFTNRTSTFSADRIRDAHYDTTTALFVIVGAAGKLATSPSGTTWTSRTSAMGATEISSVASDGSGNWVIGSTGKSGYSSNATSWTAVVVTSSGGLVCKYGNGYFVAFDNVSASFKYKSVDNGLTWTSILNSNFSTVTGPEGLVYSTDLLLWVGISNSTTGNIMYSRDDMESVLSIDVKNNSLSNSILIDATNNRFIAANSTTSESYISTTEKFEATLL